MAGAPGFSPRTNSASRPAQVIVFARASASCAHRVDTILRPAPRAHSAAPQGIAATKKQDRRPTLQVPTMHEISSAKRQQPTLGARPEADISASNARSTSVLEAALSMPWQKLPVRSFVIYSRADAFQVRSTKVGTLSGSLACRETRMLRSSDKLIRPWSNIQCAVPNNARPLLTMPGLFASTGRM